MNKGLKPLSAKVLLLTAFLCCTSNVNAEGLCARLFSRVISLVGLTRTAAVRNTPVATEPLRNIPDLPDVETRIERGEIYTSTEWALFHPEGNPALTGEERQQMMSELDSIIRSKHHTEQGNKLSAWIKSPTHAIYAIENLPYFGNHANAVLKILLATSPHFKNARAVKNGEEGIITLAYDVEDSGHDFTMMYKTPEFTDEAWLALPDAVRKDKLADAVRRYYDSSAVPPEKWVVPTGLKPRELGRLTFENDEIAEVKHRLFEIDPTKAKEQLNELFQIKKNTHSAHVHIVSEFPEDYSHLSSFLFWKSQLGNYLEYKGMEEGLVSDFNKYTGLPSADLSLAKTWLAADDKLTGLGLRTYRYGEAITSGHRRVGIEFRDATRNKDLLNRYIDASVEDIQNRPWEKAKLHAVEQKNPFIETNTFLKEIGFSEKEAQKFHFLPFNLATENFSALKIYNFETGQWQPPSTEALQRIETAKRNLITRLKKTLVEYRKYPDESEAAIYAFKLDLVDWAKEARVSELFPEHTRYSLPVKK